MDKQAVRKMQNFSSNLKKTALGVKFSRTLFTEPEKINPRNLPLILKSLGLDVPEEITIATQAAQVLVGGQAVAAGLSSGKSITELQSATNMTAASLKGLTALAERNGMMDTDSASTIQIGSSIAMICASGGLNVGAWASLALDLSQVAASKQGETDFRALMDLQNQVKQRISPQAKILGETFKDFQENKISIYGLISKMAVETPDLWPQVVNDKSVFKQLFPELMMIPTVSDSLVAYADNKIWGNWPWPMSGSYVIASWSSTQQTNIQTLAPKFTKETAASFFFEILLKPWLQSYSVANAEIVGRGNMSMENIAALTYMIDPEGEISENTDYVSYLIGSRLTPYDFGDNVLESIANQYVDENYKNVNYQFVEAAISRGLSEQNRNFNSYQSDKAETLQKLRRVKAYDNIMELAQYPYIYQKLKSYLDFETVSFEKDPTLGGKYNEKFSDSSVRSWRKLHNYISVLQMLDTFRKDPYLSGTDYVSHLLPFMPSVESFEQKVKKINFLSTMRSVNNLAKNNIASIFGVKQSQLVRVTDENFDGATKYTIKR